MGAIQARGAGESRPQRGAPLKCWVGVWCAAPPEERKEESWPLFTAIRVPGSHHMAPQAGMPAARMRSEGSQHIYRKQRLVPKINRLNVYTAEVPLEAVIRITALSSSQSRPGSWAGWSSEKAVPSVCVELGGLQCFEGVWRWSATSPLRLLPQRPWPENYLEHSSLLGVGGIHHIVKTPRLRVEW